MSIFLFSILSPFSHQTRICDQVMMAIYHDISWDIKFNEIFFPSPLMV